MYTYGNQTFLIECRYGVLTSESSTALREAYPKVGEQLDHMESYEKVVTHVLLQ